MPDDWVEELLEHGIRWVDCELKLCPDRESVSESSSESCCLVFRDGKTVELPTLQDLCDFLSTCIVLRKDRVNPRVFIVRCPYSYYEGCNEK